MFHQLVVVASNQIDCTVKHMETNNSQRVWVAEHRAAVLIRQKMVGELVLVPPSDLVLKAGLVVGEGR